MVWECQHVMFITNRWDRFANCAADSPFAFGVHEVRGMAKARYFQCYQMLIYWRIMTNQKKKRFSCTCACSFYVVFVQHTLLHASQLVLFSERSLSFFDSRRNWTPAKWCSFLFKILCLLFISVDLFPRMFSNFFRFLISAGIETLLNDARFCSNIVCLMHPSWSFPTALSTFFVFLLQEGDNAC